MATLTIELPEQVTQGQMMQALESIGCELRLASDGRNYTAVPKARKRRQAVSNLQKKAQAFRKSHEQVGAAGYVIFSGGKAVAWKCWLDHPSGWEPGCIALDRDGNQWVAAGGNKYEGTEQRNADAHPDP